jgi:hypothetical protein
LRIDLRGCSGACLVLRSRRRLPQKLSSGPVLPYGNKNGHRALPLMTVDGLYAVVFAFELFLRKNGGHNRD